MVCKTVQKLCVVFVNRTLKSSEGENASSISWNGHGIDALAAVVALTLAVVRLFTNIAVGGIEGLNFDRSSFVVAAGVCMLAIVLVLVAIIGLLGSMSNLV